MTRLAELEAMVQVAWNRGTQVAFGPDPEFSRDELRALLGVYADELQELGDPRGELVALDLLRTPTTDDHARFEALSREWLGPLAKHPNVKTRYGLVGVSITDTDDKLLSQFLATRGAPYLSSVAIFGDVVTVRSTIATLAAEIRPWLGALRIVVPSPPLGTTMSSPIIPVELAAQLVEATPALYTLATGARALLREFPHPSLRRLVIDSHEDIGAILGTGAPLPAVIELDLATTVFGSGMLPAHNWPALRRLDLSRNDAAILRLLRSCGVRHQLTHVRLPELRTQEARDLLTAARAEMPALVKLDVPPIRPWHVAALPMVLAFADEEFIVDPRSLVPAMEHIYDALPVDARMTWDDFWALASADDAEFPANALGEALVACDAFLDDPWRNAAAALAMHPEAMVQISRL